MHIGRERRFQDRCLRGRPKTPNADLVLFTAAALAADSPPDIPAIGASGLFRK